MQSLDTARSSEALGFLSATRGGELGKGPGAHSQRDLGANWREGSSSAFPKLGPRGRERGRPGGDARGGAACDWRVERGRDRRDAAGGGGAGSRGPE